MIKLIENDDRKTYTDIYRRYLGKDDNKAFNYTIDDLEKQLEAVNYKYEKCLSYLKEIRTTGVLPVDEDDSFPPTVSSLIDATDHIIYALDELEKAENILRLYY